jgi:hypothetical protein
MSTRNSSAFFLSKVFAVAVWCPLLVYGATAPCDLLTQDQVSTTVGASVGAASPIANTGCSWKGTGASKVLVSVSMQNEKMFNSVKGAPPPNTTKASISGVGDEAIFTGTQGFASLWVRKGTTYFLVRIYGLPVEEAQTKLKALGAIVASKL